MGKYFECLFADVKGIRDDVKEIKPRKAVILFKERF